MYIEEKSHFSLYYTLKNAFEPDVVVTDSYQDSPIAVPQLTIDLLDVDFSKFEIGSYNYIRRMQWIVDVFAKTKNQRDRIVYKLMNVLESKVPIYDYALGFPPTPVPIIGSLVPDKLRIEFVRIESDEPEELFYRGIGTYLAQIYYTGGN